MKNESGNNILKHEHVCPWWLCFTFDNPLRKIFQDPYKILAPHVKPGFTILDIGPGMGYFTFPLSEMTGSHGRVIALDIQPRMLQRLEMRSVKRNRSNITIKLYDGENFLIDEKIDFALLFWMYHEVSNKPSFINELRSVLKPGGRVLIAEPKIHVSGKNFESSVRLFTDNGFSSLDEPVISLSRGVLLEKQ